MFMRAAMFRNKLWPFFLILFQTAVSFNLLWVNEEKNMPANRTIGSMLGDPSILSSLTIDDFQTVMTSNDSAETVQMVCDAISQMTNPPHLLLDSTTAGKSSQAIRSLGFSLGIPTVALSYGDMEDLGEWETLNEEQKKYLIQMRPPGDTMTHLVRQVIDDQNITNAAIIFDSQFVMSYKYRSLLINVPVRHLINKMRMTEAEIETHLMQLQDIDLNNIFLLMSVKNAEMYLKVANKIKMYGMKYSWFLLTKDDSSNLKCDCAELTMITMSAMSKENDMTTSIMRSYGLEGIPSIDIAFFYDAAGMATTGMDNVAPLISDYSVQNCADFANTAPVERTNIGLRAAVNAESANFNHYGRLEALMNGANNEFNYGIKIMRHEFKNKKAMKREEIGTWDAKTSQISYRNGRNLDGIAATTVYKVAVVLQAPFVMMKNDSSGYEGYCIDLIDELKALMGFKYEIFEATDGTYGTMNDNEEWSGMISDLINKKADIALGALSVMAERENVVDFTVPYYDLVGITIMMKKPKTPTSLFKFLSVLEDSVWGCILAAYFITSVLMWVFDRWSPYSYQNNMEKYKDDDEKRYFNLKECLWFCMTSLTPQGGGEAPKNLSGRLVAATWWLFGFIIIASYTANLAAFLTVSRLETPVESLEDLSKQYKIQYSPMNHSATMTYFQRMAYIEEKFYEIWKDMSLNDSMSDLERSKLAVWDYPVSDKYTKMWQSMQEAGLPMDFEEAVKRVRESKSSSEGYAFLGDATDIRYKALTDCDFEMVGEEFSRKPYALAVQQGSPLKDQFNDAILKLLNQRKLETLKERWWNQNPLKQVCDDDDDSGGGISIYNIGGVFIVIFVGIGLAIVTLIFEYWYYKYKKPASRVDSGNKKFQVKQAMASSFQDRKEYETEYRSNTSNIAPVGNPW